MKTTFWGIVPTNRPSNTKVTSTPYQRKAKSKDSTKERSGQQEKAAQVVKAPSTHNLLLYVHAP
jgi:hypothetical protein